MKDLGRIENLEMGYGYEMESSDDSSKSRASKGSIKWEEVLKRFEILKRKLREGSEVVEVMRLRAKGLGDIEGVLGGGDGDGEEERKREGRDKAVQTDVEKKEEMAVDGGSPGRLLRRKPNLDDLRRLSEGDVHRQDEHILTKAAGSE